ncbi:glycosyltransferase [Pseudoduganella umbonata]|uniref:Glycosyltransferase family 1 protein n=1 Tax=Pseudoduganella umbonata TaxID=864828 RepID=A0A4V1EDB9_9BURK|nr:glycosyltransferase [Pseudoduganella umbonata]MBB3221380.1 UDP:flavonoid glycosyltransferase YjiC (YdhE family) [Pseudoduganella umbonata]QCP10541.1 glycosyltransferase family 1 protein [Pseudoduganella umbonata]
MKIGLQTWGSHGDIRPFLALAEGLNSAGHDVILVVTCVDSDAYARHVSPSGVEIRVVASPVLGPEDAGKIGATVFDTRDPMRQMAKILRLAFTPVEDRMFAAAQQLCDECDIVIGHFFMHPLRAAAERAGRPYASVMLSHGGIPSACDHPMRVRGSAKLANRLLWWITRLAINRALMADTNRLRARAGLPPVRDMIDDVWLSPSLTLVAVSPTIAVRQPDWPAAVQLSGFLDMPNIDVEGTVAPELGDFLAAGEAPVYMTLGSWMPADIDWQRQTLQLLTDAARQAGCRAIIQSADAAACRFTSSDRFLYVPAAPHQGIFPHCCAVLHHGGAGTTQSATLAGKPSVVVPHISEQEHWGRELQRLGVAGKPVHRRKATAEALARLIRQVRDTPAMTRAAVAAGAAMRRENGVATAVELVDRVFTGMETREEARVEPQEEARTAAR